MSEQHQAELLARWLADGARGDPPADVDADALEAVYALRPDLAPAARLSVDDILGDVQAGPFAAASAEVVALRPEDDGLSLTSVPPPPTRARPQRGLPWRVIAGGGAGLLAAAAAVLIVVLPQDNPVHSADVASAPAKPAPRYEAAPSKVYKDVKGGPAAGLGADDDAVAFEDEAEATPDVRPANDLDLSSTTRGASTTKVGSKDVKAPAAERKAEASALDDAVADGLLSEDRRDANDEDGDGVRQTAEAFDATQTAIPEVSREQAKALQALGYVEGDAAGGYGSNLVRKRAAPQDAPSVEADVAPQEAASAPDAAMDAEEAIAEAEPAAAPVAKERREDDGLPEASAIRVTSQVNRLKAQAETDPLTAAHELAAWVREPASGGTIAALNAARWYVAAGRDDLALGVIARGLDLKDPPASRAAQLRALRAEILAGRE